MRSVSVVLPLSMCAEMPMFLAKGSIAANAAAVDANDRDDDGGGAIEETIADAGEPTRRPRRPRRAPATRARRPRAERADRSGVQPAGRAPPDGRRLARPRVTPHRETAVRGCQCGARGARRRSEFSRAVGDTLPPQSRHRSLRAGSEGDEASYARVARGASRLDVCHHKLPRVFFSPRARSRRARRRELDASSPSSPASRQTPTESTLAFRLAAARSLTKST